MCVYCMYIHVHVTDRQRMLVSPQRHIIVCLGFTASGNAKIIIPTVIINVGKRVLGVQDNEMNELGDCIIGVIEMKGN